MIYITSREYKILEKQTAKCIYLFPSNIFLYTFGFISKSGKYCTITFFCAKTKNLIEFD